LLFGLPWPARDSHDRHDNQHDEMTTSVRQKNGVVTHDGPHDGRNDGMVLMLLGTVLLVARHSTFTTNGITRTSPFQRNCPQPL